jgi:uncharacterized protein (DUF2147 family)
MKKSFLLLLILIHLASYINGESNPKSIIGIWISDKQDGKVEFYQIGNRYFGKLIWGKNLMDSKGNPRKDVYNPNDELKNRSLLNTVLFTDFIYKDGEWEDGKIYDPTSGKTYNAILKVKNNNLEIRGYIGIPLLGKTKVWQRVN